MQRVYNIIVAVLIDYTLPLQLQHLYHNLENLLGHLLQMLKTLLGYTQTPGAFHIDCVNPLSTRAS